MSAIMLRVKMPSAVLVDCRNGADYAECRYALCRCVECRGTIFQLCETRLGNAIKTCMSS